MRNKQNHQPENDLPKLASPAQRALAAAGIQRLDQLPPEFSEEQLKQLHGIDPNALGKLNAALAARGLSFSQGKGIE